MSRKPRRDFDSPWNDALQDYFADFLQFFLPEAHAEIDWSHSPEFLDQELRRVLGGAGASKLAVDKLVKVCLRAGSEEWVLVHVEVQSQRQVDFARRMFVYHSRIFERYGHLVCNIAVLADETHDWRPNHFGHSKWRTTLAFDYLAAKLADFRQHWEALEVSDNPFAIVVMAHLKSQETSPDSRERLSARLALARRLRTSGRSQEDILKLLRLIEGLMALTNELEWELYETEKAYEQETTMPLTTFAERIGRERGYREGVEQGIEQGKQMGLREGLLTAIELSLQLAHGDAGRALFADVVKIQDLARLEEFYTHLASGTDLDELRQQCAEN